MTQTEIQRKLYVARNEYLKAMSQMKFYQREIAFLKECESALNRSDLFSEFYGDTPLAEEVYGG